VADECSLAGVVRAHLEAKKAGIPFIVGAEFVLTNADGAPALRFTALAMTREGYGNLSELITLARMRAEKGRYRLATPDLDRPEPEHAHLRGLPDCLVILSPDYPATESRLDPQLEWFAATFGERAWVALTLHARAMDDIHRGVTEQVAARHSVPVVATGAPVMHVRSRKPLQDVLTAIRLGKPVAECGYDLAPNAEQHLRSRLRLANLYPARALAETVEIARRCTFSLDELRYEYPDELVPSGLTPEAYLRQETYTGAHRRWPIGIPHRVQEQIEHELALIADLSYEPYGHTSGRRRVSETVPLDRRIRLIGVRIGSLDRARVTLPPRRRRSGSCRSIAEVARFQVDREASYWTRHTTVSALETRSRAML